MQHFWGSMLGGYMEAGEARFAEKDEVVASGERRHSITQLQGVLNRVSLSPFNSKYKTLVSSPSESSFSSTPDSQSKQENGFLIDLSSGTETSGNQLAQNGQENRVKPFRPRAQNGATSQPSNPFFSAPESKVSALSESSTTVNPFSTEGKDSSINLVGDRKIILPNVKDLVSRSEQSHAWPQDSASAAEVLDPFKEDFVQNDWAVFPPPSSYHVPKDLQVTSNNHTSDIFQATPPSWLTDIPQTLPSSQKEDTVFQSIAASEIKENAEPSNERDFLLEFILANQKNDCQPSPTTTSSGSDIFKDTSAFLPPPAITKDSFQGSDVFSGTPTSVSSDIFQTPLSSVENKAFQSTPLFQTPAFIPSEIKAFDPLSDDYVVNDGFLNPLDKLFGTAVGTNHDTDGTPTEQRTGAFQDKSPVISPVNASTDGGLMFRRRPPKPTPRRIPKNSNQAVDQHSLSKPAPPTSAPAHSTTPWTPLKPIQTPTYTPVLPTSIQNDAPDDQVYEDVLLIGQEKCVEDWPEDSPQLSPDWKPTGKLRLRRDSLRTGLESVGSPSSETLGKKHSKVKLSKKLRSSFLSRRGSKDKFGDELKVAQTATLGRESMERNSDSMNVGYGGTLPWGTKFPDVPSDEVFSSDQDEQGATAASRSVKKKKTKLVVPQLRYRTSKKLPNDVTENGSGHSTFLHASKEDLLEEVPELRSDIKMGGVEKYGPEMKDCRPKEPLKFKPVVPSRSSKEILENDPNTTNGFAFVEESKADAFVKADAERNYSPANLQAYTPNVEEGATGYTPSWETKDEPLSLSGVDQFTPIDDRDKRLEMQDCGPKKPVKFKLPRLPRKGSKSSVDEVPQKGADLFKASDSFELNRHEVYSEKPPILRVPPLSRRDSEGLQPSETPDKGADLFKAGDYEDAESWMEEYSPDTKPHKDRSTHTANTEARAKDKAFLSEDLEPPGATSSDFYLSEAAKAEWMSSQMDVRRARMPEEEGRLEGVEEEEEEGDTDSLMEWWNTVELWDELPSEEDISMKEDETKSFTEIAGKVHRGLRVFYKVFTEQAEVLYQHVQLLYAIADDLSNFHRRAKIANITGGTTTAVGGVAAIAGLALAPVTFGASLIVSAVGLGVATAGGIAAASAAISDNVHDMNDRKKIEIVVQDYETRLAELQRCLRFVSEGIRRLRCHPLLRRNNYYAGDWEVRRSLQTVSLVTDPVEHAEETVDIAMAALSSVCKGMDKYFTKDSRELRKGCKKEVTMRVRMLAKQLHEGLVELNSIREQLLDATGHV